MFMSQECGLKLGFSLRFVELAGRGSDVIGIRETFMCHSSHLEIGKGSVVD